MEVNDYIELYKEINSQVGSESVAITILDQLGRDRRSREIAEQRRGSGGVTAGRAEGQASAKQIAYLQSLGVEASTDLTMLQASQLIEDAIAQAAV